QLSGAPPVLELPTDYPRPAQISYRGSHLTFQLPATLGQELRALAQREGVTYFMLLFAAFLTLLTRYTGQEDIVVGTPVAGRQRRETEDLIGFFINTLALRVDLAGNPTFATLLQRVREVCLGAYDHQDVPFEKLVDELQPDRSLSYTPLFQVVFALQHAAEESVELPGITLHQMEWASETAKFDLTFNLTEASDDLYAWVEYNTDIFAPDTITRLFRHWQHILEGVVADAQQPLAAISLMSEQERRQVVVDWNATQTDYPRQSSIQQVFEAQAAATPDAVAVVCEDEQVTYGELNRRANQLAHYLRHLKVGPEMPVGLCVERSPDLIIGLLGILKAGGFYVPIDPAYPRERIGFMIADASVNIVLTKADLQAAIPSADLSVILLDRFWQQIALQSADNPVVTTTAENLAYVNYTSGSTGLPKGVCIPHQAVVRLVKENTFARLTADEVFLQFATIAFDAATLETWGPLLNGGRLVIFPPGTPDLEELGKTLVRYHVTTLWLTAGLFHLMVEEQLDSLKHVRQLLAGGDVLSVPHVRKILQTYPGNTLINGYGPTEGTTFTCCYPMTSVDQVGPTVSIGKPIANTQIFILDSAMQPVPVGVPGELYIGGDGLARGYLRRPELTSAAFVKHPLSPQPDARLYRTGDLVRYLADGNVEFLGRVDQQVKINGYRIEPGEVETVLAQHPDVRDCVVIARRDGAAAARLVAYVTLAREHAVTAAEMRVYLKERL
ncbi:MAG TPA: amino acid adenylation domain-containing protein, partial [Ktedonobacterales bacterium]|nr:amino acid adenylation domain-containing protein [Ktedonobacterales bacterium]